MSSIEQTAILQCQEKQPSHWSSPLKDGLSYCLQMCTSCFVSAKRTRPKTCQFSVCLFQSKLLSNFRRALRIEELPHPGKMMASIGIGTCVCGFNMYIIYILLCYILCVYIYIMYIYIIIYNIYIHYIIYIYIYY